ncbi:MAG: glutamate--cysteine ligase [Phycisphaerae bacterium]|nr:glutamate--cysteine ligase [Phycisphaerae bacterium]MAB82212.1 glutamate--cysteine ligase [Phycisphaerae bacterium]|tara:strand:- start:3273 stop:4409 length:1137 start_codon:yes stop_codon:yes gene_type:complete
MHRKFNSSPEHTIGVEIELGLVDKKSGALVNEIDFLMDACPDKWKDSVKHEFMQSYCEFNTGVCHTVDEVRADFAEKLQWGYDVADQRDMTFLWSGTHPFSHWEDQKLSPGERYEWLMNTMQYVSRRLVVFGLHVHVGVDSGDKAIQMCDRLLRHLPTLLALSSNSPHWLGNDTGLHTYRSKLMESLPTAGMPETLRNWSEYIWLIEHLISTGFIHSPNEIWWDVRPSPQFGTVEIRVMDTPINMKHLLGLVALSQSLIAGISEQIDRGAYLYDSHPMIARQNKWHAVRYGMDASFVDFDTMLAVPARQVARRLLDQCAPHAERLGCIKELGYVEEIIEQGSGADAQNRAWDKTGDMHQVVDRILDKTGKPWDMKSAE